MSTLEPFASQPIYYLRTKPLNRLLIGIYESELIKFKEKWKKGKRLEIEDLSDVPPVIFYSLKREIYSLINNLLITIVKHLNMNIIKDILSQEGKKIEFPLLPFIIIESSENLKKRRVNVKDKYSSRGHNGVSYRLFDKLVEKGYIIRVFRSLFIRSRKKIIAETILVVTSKRSRDALIEILTSIKDTVKNNTKNEIRNEIRPLITIIIDEIPFLEAIIESIISAIDTVKDKEIKPIPIFSIPGFVHEHRLSKYGDLFYNWML